MGIKIATVHANIAGVHCLVPASELDAEEVQKLPLGEVYTTEFKKMRNWRFHRKFFAMLGIAFDNMPDDIKDARNIHTMDGMLIDLKLLLGHYDLFVSLEGVAMYVPKSISFAAMDEDDFQQFYQRTLDIVIGRYTLGMDDRRMEQMVSQVMGFM